MPAVTSRLLRTALSAAPLRDTQGGNAAHMSFNEPQTMYVDSCVSPLPEQRGVASPCLYDLEEGTMSVTPPRRLDLLSRPLVDRASSLCFQK